MTAPCRHQYWDLGRCIDCWKTATDVDIERRLQAAAAATKAMREKELEAERRPPKDLRCD